MTVNRYPVDKDLALNPAGNDSSGDAHRLRSILRVAPIGIGVTVQRVIKEANRRLCEMTGYALEELIGSGARMLYPSDREFERVGEVKYAQIHERGTGTVQTRWLRKDGTPIDVLLSSTPLDPADLAKGITFTALDITRHKRRETELREREQQYRLLFEMSPCGILIEDARGNIIDANPAVCRMLGWRREELIGRSVGEISREPDDLVRRHIAQLLEGESLTHETVNVRHDGTLCHMELHETALTLPSGQPGLMVLSNDITARKRAEEGLRRREDYLMALSELSRECLSLTDKRACCQAVVERIGPAARASRAYVFLDRRDAAGRLLASQIAEWCAGDASPEIDNPLLQNMSYEDLFPYGPDIFARGECMMGRVAEMTDVERALLEPQGIKAIMLVPILVNGRVLGFLGFDNCRDDKNWEANDQAFLRAAASSLGEALNRIDSESRLTRLMQAIKQAEEAIILTDTQGTIQFANPAFARMSGYGIPEIAGKNIEEFEQGEEREAIVQGIREILCAGGTWTRRSVNKRKDGTPYSEETTISPVRDAENKIIGHIAIRRDITREIELEEQLRQSQKMDAVGQLAGGVAHDFNNLLQAINGYTELALQSAADEHAVREYAQEVLKAGERAAGLVGQLLAFSRRQMMKPCHLDLNEVIGNLLKMLDRLIGEHIRLDFVPGHCLDAIHGDRGQIEQVLMNMCINARDAMPDGGRLTLETANVPFHDAHGRPSSPAPEGHGVSLKIADTGCGMDKATRERIFEPFFTTKAIGKGTGLGLATVYGIVRQHRGSIQVHSEPGEGAAFEIVFPASGEPATDSAPSVNVSDSRGIETILVAEDESIVRGFVGHVLERAGYKVLMASDGLEALRLFESNPGSIDLLLFDMIMPNLGGAAACERIRALRPGVRVLFASGYSPEATNIKNNVLAGQAMIQKPYTREELLRAVRQALEDRTA